MHPALKILLIGLAGAAGAVLRYGIGVLSMHLPRPLSDLPVATFAVNAVGSFLFGVVFASRFSLDPFRMGVENQLGRDVKTVILAGFLGALTTYSAFSYESGTLLLGGEHHQPRPGIGAAYIALMTATAIGLFVLGSRLGRAVSGWA